MLRIYQKTTYNKTHYFVFVMLMGFSFFNMVIPSYNLFVFCSYLCFVTILGFAVQNRAKTFFILFFSGLTPRVIDF
jgi:Mg2+/Co2+ transporter CorB